MSDEQPGGELWLEHFPEPETEREKGISLVWVVPLVALLIAGWIGWKAWSEQGPTIYITFKNAEGIEPGKTRIRYRNVDLGRVTRLTLASDRKEVMVKAEMATEAGRFLNAGTRFWVVRPRIDPGGISGLSTLVSGAYIEMDPGSGDGDGARLFMGLAEPPVITNDEPGSYFRLNASQIGSIGRKSPVYHRRIQVGEVVNYRLAPGEDAVEVQIFINAPYDAMVYENTRFWHAGGIEASLDANGFQFRAEALRALLAGGVGFGLPEGERPVGPPGEEQVFVLHDSYDKARERGFTGSERYLLYFQSSVRGLQPGAPVEFLGIPVGQVHSFDLQVDAKTADYRIPVVIEIEPERFGVGDGSAAPLFEQLVARGLRARLSSANLLTGQLYIALEMAPNAPQQRLTQTAEYPVIPTLPGEMDDLIGRMDGLLGRVEGLPLERIAADLERLIAGAADTVAAPEVLETLRLARDSMQRLDRLLHTTESQVAVLGDDFARMLSDLDALLVRAEAALASLEEDVVDEDSEFQYQLYDTMDEVSRAARAIRSAAEYLERNPDSLLLGKPTQ